MPALVIPPGVFIAILSSVVNALCDPLRKYLTQFMDPFSLVASRGLIQAPIFIAWAVADTGGVLPPLNRLFWLAAGVSGGINIATSYLYNRSVQISSISATVPFLSFTPAFLVVVAFLLLGEVPTTWGFLGITIAAAGGAWLQGCSDDPGAKDLSLNPHSATKGAVYMVLVAFLWSISNAFDKIGVQNSTALLYGATIQTIVAVGCGALRFFQVGRHEIQDPIGMKTKIPWKVVALTSVTSVFAYYINLVATQQLEVSYVIAIKRSGCIWSVLLGKVFFHERNLRKKLPSICLMVLGVVCIVIGNET